MKLLFIASVLFALIYLAHLAPVGSGPTRELVLPQYDDDDETTPEIKKLPVKNDDDDDDEYGAVNDDDEEEEDSTTTTTTTRATTRASRTSFSYPTRNRFFIPSRRTFPPIRSSSARSSPATSDLDELITTDAPNYDGDFKYIRDFRKYIQQLLDDIRKLVLNLTGYDFSKTMQRINNRPPTDD